MKIRIYLLALAAVAFVIAVFSGSVASTGSKNIGKPSSLEKISFAEKTRSSKNMPLLKSASPEKASSRKRIVGYYAGWAAYSGFEVSDIDAGKLTHMNYAFAKISKQGKIALTDPETDLKNFHALRQLKQKHPHLKTFISVGGWSHSHHFSDVALTEKSRTVFAESCITFIKKYGFDGIDIDWEYPVSGGAPGTEHRPEDKENFTLLLKKIREKLDQLEQQTGNDYLLTIAGAAGTRYINHTEMAKLIQYVDYINLMTYDINGQWYDRTGHNAPLYTSSGNPPYEWSTAATVQAYVKAGVPNEKIVVGIPFYGRKYDGAAPMNHGLHQPFLHNGGALAYDEIKEKYLTRKDYTRYWDKETKVPYLWNGTTFISYEGPESIRYKADYIKKQELGGAMIWELSQDHNGSLLTSLYNQLRK